MLHHCGDPKYVTFSDPQPVFDSTSYRAFVKENVPALQLILNVSVRVGTKEKARADVMFVIISGLARTPVTSYCLQIPVQRVAHLYAFTEQPRSLTELKKL